MENYALYQELIKPGFAPPAWVFAPVWSVLYILIAVSFGVVFYRFFRKDIPERVVLPFIFNIFFNFVYTPIQFGLQSNILALLDILLVVGTLIWAMKVIWPRLRWVVYANIPYLLWASFATILQVTIVFLN